MSGRLQGRVAVITGASKGIGKAIALALAAEGVRIALVSRNRELLAGVADEIRGAGGDAHSFPADVSVESDVRRVERDVVAAFGKVHILINNAGINIRRKITDFTMEEWNQVIGTNLTSAFLLCRSFVPHMRGEGYGRVINIASTMGWISLPERGAYSASKAGLIGMTRALALELAPEGMTVNSISPGPLATEMNRSLLDNPQISAQFLANVPLGRWGKPEEIGALALHLCLEEAGFITGADILVDGGWTAR